MDELEKLKQDQDEADKRRLLFNTLGNVADNMANVPSTWAIMKGREGRHIDAGQGLREIAASTRDPWERRSQLLGMSKALREEKVAAAESDPNSAESQSARQAYASFGLKVPANASAASLAKAYGKANDYALTRFKEGEQRKTELAKLDAKAPKGMMWSVNQETGEKQLVPADQAIKPTQYAAGTFAHRLSQAEDAMAALQNKGYDPTTMGAAVQRVGLFPEFLKEGDQKQQEQAERNFVNAVLRRESGANITKDEFSSAEKQYFPRVGDNADVLAQKAQNRATALAGLRAEAGPAMDKVGQQLANIPVQAPKKQAQGGTAFAGDAGPHGPSVTQNGHTYMWNPQTKRYE